MSDDLRHLAQGLLKEGGAELGERERRVLARIAQRVHISRDTSGEFEGKMTFGERLADSVASFGGSWTFISMFAATLAAWTGLNALVLGEGRAFDPYPFIFLNLILSMLAAIQAPIIMMSQNRQSAKDRAAAEHDYEVNLKAELEIMALHEKLDTFRTRQLSELLRYQEEQIAMLRRLCEAKAEGPSPG